MIFFCLSGEMSACEAFLNLGFNAKRRRLGGIDFQEGIRKGEEEEEEN